MLNCLLLHHLSSPHLTGLQGAVLLGNCYATSNSLYLTLSCSCKLALFCVLYCRWGFLGCRYVRQESPLWSALHNGVLTSSTLNGALGFYEPGAVQRLGLPKHFVRHSALLAAYSNLLQPEYIFPLQV